LPALLILALSTTTAQATTPALTTLYSFVPSDGFWPNVGLTIGSGGVLYGTTVNGGQVGIGTVYSLTPPSSAGGAWTCAVLHSFAGSAAGDGDQPNAGVVIGSGGVLYGMTPSGGTGPCNVGCGIVYSLTPPASPGGAWTETVLHSFTGGGDGGYPYGGLVIGKGGVLYGTTELGGTGPCSSDISGCGTVFSLTPPTSPGEAWTEAVLYSFNGSPGDGAAPLAGVVIRAESGGQPVLYGTTLNGGTGSCAGVGDSVFPGCGTVFSLAPPASPGEPWTETVFHSFAGSPSDGAGPASPLVIGGGGVLYGTTPYGGVATANCLGSTCGTIFSVTPPAAAGGAWTESVLHQFTGFPSDGSYPGAGVVMDGGRLYGTTEYGGSASNGTVFSLTPPTSAGGSWTEAVLHNFPGYAGLPGSVVAGKSGVLYGTTQYGGNRYRGSTFGTVFSFK